MIAKTIAGSEDLFWPIYDEESDKFEIAYEDEEEHCFFNLLVDYSVGDLKIIK